MIGKNRPDGTAMPNVIRPSTRYKPKNIVKDNGWNSVEVFVEKMFLTASSFVENRRLARSLYCPAGQLNCLKFPVLPVVGHGSDIEESQGEHLVRNGRPKRQHEVNNDTDRLRSSLCNFPFLEKKVTFF